MVLITHRVQLHKQHKTRKEIIFTNYSEQKLIFPLTADRALIQNGLKHDVGAQAF